MNSSIKDLCRCAEMDQKLPQAEMPAGAFESTGLPFLLENPGCHLASIIGQAPIVVPFIVHHARFRVFYQLLQAALMQAVLLFLDLDGVDADSLIQVRKTAEVFPDRLVSLQRLQNVVVYHKTGRRQVRERDPPRIGHASQPLHPAATRFIQFGPETAPPAGSQPLGGPAVTQLFGGAVDSAETQGFFHRVYVPAGPVVFRPAPFYDHTALLFRLVMLHQPGPQLIAVFRI